MWPEWAFIGEGDESANTWPSRAEDKCTGCRYGRRKALSALVRVLNAGTGRSELVTSGLWCDEVAVFHASLGHINDTEVFKRSEAESKKRD